MKKYLLKRILFSIFALLVVVGTVMVLVYSAIDRELVFVNDPMVTKRANNELAMYKYQQWQKYGYLEYTDYTSFVYNTFKKEKGADFDRTDTEYTTALKAIDNADTYLNNEYVQKFYQNYKSGGYKVVYLAPMIRTRKELDPNTGTMVDKQTVISQPYLIAKRDITFL